MAAGSIHHDDYHPPAVRRRALLDRTSHDFEPSNGRVCDAHAHRGTYRRATSSLRNLPLEAGTNKPGATSTGHAPWPKATEGTEP